MQMRSGSVTTVVLASVAGLILMMSMVVPTALIGNYRNGDLDKPTGTFSGYGTGCYLEDNYFTDTSVSNDPQAVFDKLITQYKNASDKKEYIEKILSESKKEGVNGAVIIGIWNGEQSFGKPEDAFGFGNLDNGENLVTGFDNELVHVIRVIKDAINNRGKYTKPEGGNIITRLFYTYATAMNIQYTESGGKWLREYNHSKYGNPYYNRLNVVQLLVPDQVKCETFTQFASTEDGTGNTPFLSQKDSRYANKPYGSSTISASGCCTVSAAMVLLANGIQTDAVEISSYSAANGYYIAGEGTNHAGLYPKLANKYSLKFENYGTNWDRAKAKLKNGSPVIARGEGADPYTKNGHCIVIVAYDSSTGKYTVHDPKYSASNGGITQYPENLMKSLTTVIYYLGK